MYLGGIIKKLHMNGFVRIKGPGRAYKDLSLITKARQFSGAQGRANDGHIRILFKKYGQAAAFVRFHMRDEDIFECFFFQNCFDLR